jgi:hypothetical protein
MIYVAEHIEPACLPLPAILIAHPLDQAAAMRMMQNAPPACLSEDLRRRLERLGAQLRPIPRLPRLALYSGSVEGETKIRRRTPIAGIQT